MTYGQKPCYTLVFSCIFVDWLIIWSHMHVKPGTSAVQGRAWPTLIFATMIHELNPDLRAMMAEIPLRAGAQHTLEGFNEQINWVFHIGEERHIYLMNLLWWLYNTTIFSLATTNTLLKCPSGNAILTPVSRRNRKSFATVCVVSIKVNIWWTLKLCRDVYRYERITWYPCLS